MKNVSKRNLLLAACALALGVGLSFSAFARPCCSQCPDDDPSSVCWRICFPDC